MSLSTISIRVTAGAHLGPKQLELCSPCWLCGYDKVCFSSLVPIFALTCKQGGRTELEDADMKEIDGLLSHIDKITHDARSGHKQDSDGMATQDTFFLLSRERFHTSQEKNLFAHVAISMRGCEQVDA
jgi:hypothetical protein